MFASNDTNIRNRAMLIFVPTVVALVIAAIAFLYIGITSGKLNSKVWQPLKENLAYLANELVPEPVKPAYRYIRNIYSNSSVNVIINNGGSPTIYHYQQRSITPFPTIDFSTPTPDPKWVQWEADFQQKKLDIQKQNEETRQNICRDFPDASICN